VVMMKTKEEILPIYWTGKKLNLM